MGRRGLRTPLTTIEFFYRLAAALDQEFFIASAPDDEPAMGAIRKGWQWRLAQPLPIRRDPLCANVFLLLGEAQNIIGFDGAVMAYCMTKLIRIDRNTMESQNCCKGNQA